MLDQGVTQRKEMLVSKFGHLANLVKTERRGGDALNGQIKEQTVGRGQGCLIIMVT
jgi:hypothetical protein